MEKIEVTGKNVDEALTNALLKLETTSDMVDYEVIEKGSSGFLGIASKPAKLLVWKKEEAACEADVAEASCEAATSAASASSVDKAPVSNSTIENRIRTFLGDIFKTMEIEVDNIDIEIKEASGSAASEDDAESKEDIAEICVNLVGKDLGVLIGKRGQTLDSLQYLTSLVANKGCDRYYRLKLDTENYRERRKATLESLAKNIAYKVKRTRRPVSLEPMNPYERRIIHSALQNDRYVTTRSEGEGSFRHVIVCLKK